MTKIMHYYIMRFIGKSPFPPVISFTFPSQSHPYFIGYDFQSTLICGRILKYVTAVD